MNRVTREEKLQKKQRKQSMEIERLLLINEQFHLQAFTETDDKKEN